MHGGAVGASLLKKKECVEGGAAYLVRDGVWLSLEQLAKIVERTKAALSLEELSGGVLTGLCRGGAGVICNVHE